MASKTSARSQAWRSSLPKFIYHPTFSAPDAERTYAEGDALGDDSMFDRSHMPDDVTRDNAQRMHYAAWRAHQARGVAAASAWSQTSFRLRDRVVLGNRKLAYRAVRQRMAETNRSDDLVGECHLVLIHAVAAYNPWLGIRFSTYAYTCLIRALGRLSQRISTDWLSRSVPLDTLPDGDPGEAIQEDAGTSHFPPLELYFRANHPLLSDREKTVLSRRFGMAGASEVSTLEMVGKDLGLSKERVRQVQASALLKLRHALLTA
jgi:RNA polymerase sigma factor (sigma-70 family)